MTIDFDFLWELPSGQTCEVEAVIEPFSRGNTNCLPEDAYPSEGGYAEITSVKVRGEAPDGKRGTLVALDLEDFWVAKRPCSLTKQPQFAHYLDDLAETAYSQWESGQ